MAGVKARLRPEFRLKYPALSLTAWYEVEPLFPGLTDRRLNFFGQRVARLRVGDEHLEVLAEHLEFQDAATPAE